MVNDYVKGASRMVRLLQNKRRELDRELAALEAGAERDRETLLKEIQSVDETISQLNESVLFASRNQGVDDSGNNERSIH